MIIQPGVDQQTVSNFVELVLTDSKRVVDILFMDSSGNPTNITETANEGELGLSITELDGTAVYSENYWPPQVIPSRRISNPSTGRYQLNFGTVAGETDSERTLLANWHVRKDATSEDIYSIQVLEIHDPSVFSLLPRLRFMVDKSLKVCVPQENAFLGYSDSQLIIGLQLGLSMINSAQPYPYWAALSDFPMERYGDVLIKAAMYQILSSQALFAIDSDVPSFNDQGHSFSFDHFPKLSQFLGMLKTELDKSIVALKMHYVQSGSIGIEASLSAGFYRLLSSSPSGSLYRNWWATP